MLFNSLKRQQLFSELNTRHCEGLRRALQLKMTFLAHDEFTALLPQH